MANQLFGNAIDWLGTALHLPELGYSERAAQAPTINTNVTPQSQQYWQSTPTPTQQAATINPTKSSNIFQGALGTATTSGNPTGGSPVAPVQQQNINNGGGQNVSSGPDYSGFFSQLDSMLGNLSNQSQQLQNVAQEQTNQQQNTLDLQNTQGQEQLNQYQTKTLKDIGSNIANAFKSGNNYLGSLGAGDSSAASQYAYALAKEGSKLRGGVMQDVSQRLQGLKQTYDTATNNLKASLNQQVNSIAQWFSQQQQALMGQKAEVAKQQSDQAYQIAVNALQTVQQQAAGMQNALNTWVANNATSIQQAQQQIQQNVKNNPIPTAMNFSPQASVASAAPAYFNGANGTDNTKQTNGLFNNYNWLKTG